jgi:hypothetical protein
MNWQTPERPPNKTPLAAPKGPKIIVQYRARGGKTYELENAGVVVVVHIARVEEDGPWEIDAQPGGVPDGSKVEGRGATAAEALSEVARAWSSHTPALSAFDWDAVARELKVVQAI